MSLREITALIDSSRQETSAKVFLIYWKEEDSVSVTRRDDMVEQVCEPSVGDVVKVKYQRQIYEGVVAEVGTPDAMNLKEEAFLRGEYTPFSRKRPASPSSDLTVAKKSKEDKENVTPRGRGRGRGCKRDKTSTGRGGGTDSRGRSRGRGASRGRGVSRGRGGRGTRSNEPTGFIIAVGNDPDSYKGSQLSLPKPDKQWYKKKGHDVGKGSGVGNVVGTDSDELKTPPPPPPPLPPLPQADPNWYKYANESKGSEAMDICSVGDGDDEDTSSDEDEDPNDPAKSSSDEGLNESDELHLEIKVMYQGMRLRKVEEDMQAIIAQQQLILNKLSILESYMPHQFPQQQPQVQANTPQSSYRATSTSTPHHQLELVSSTPASTHQLHPYQQPMSAGPSTSHQLFPPTQTATSPYLPPAPAATTTAQQSAQLKKVKANERALPSGAIQESLDDVDDVMARYPNLKGAKLPTLAMKLAKEAVFGEKIMKQCTPLGSRSLPGLPTAELNKLKEVLFRHTPQFWGNPAEFETLWSDCIASIGQACKRLRK